MKIVVFSTKPYDRTFLDRASEGSGHSITYLTVRLTTETAPLAAGFDVACAFVSDAADRAVLRIFKDAGVKAIALRCAGFNNVDLLAAEELGIAVVRVPAYSPHAVAEHTVALMLALNRKTHRAYNRVREGNFSLVGLLGFDMYQRTAGIIGTGQIGAAVAQILNGFGCKLLAYDVRPNPACEAVGAKYCSLDELYAQSDIITLHCPLTPATHYLINDVSLARMKDGVMLINTSRGAIVDTQAVTAALKSGKLGYLGLDVYEEEADLFFEDLSDRVLQDDALARLLTFPNVMITGHQAFFTHEALERIAQTTVDNLNDLAAGRRCPNVVLPVRVKK